jgi:hypothetical protein
VQRHSLFSISPAEFYITNRRACSVCGQYRNWTFFHFFPLKILGDLAGIPAITALFGALFQLGRDSIAHDRALRLEDARNRFTVGATSHMANVAFDKHVAFCEEYVAEMFKALETLFRKGPHADALKHATYLFIVRNKWAVWLTPEIEKELDVFEGAIRTMGASAWLVNQIPGEQESIKRMFLEFAKILGPKRGIPHWGGEVVSEEYAIDTILASLRKVLGINDLARLRGELVSQAMTRLKANG